MSVMIVVQAKQLANFAWSYEAKMRDIRNKNKSDTNTDRMRGEGEQIKRRNEAEEEQEHNYMEHR